MDTITSQYHVGRPVLLNLNFVWDKPHATAMVCSSVYRVVSKTGLPQKQFYRCLKCLVHCVRKIDMALDRVLWTNRIQWTRCTYQKRFLIGIGLGTYRKNGYLALAVCSLENQRWCWWNFIQLPSLGNQWGEKGHSENLLHGKPQEPEVFMLKGRESKCLSAHKEGVQPSLPPFQPTQALTGLSNTWSCC